MAKISVRYFRVLKADQASPNFNKVLKACSKKTLKKRQREIGDAGDQKTIRLEQFKKSGHHIYGELVKIDKDNWPMEADDTGLKELKIDGNLGYSICFAYDKKLSILAIQFNPFIISVGKFSEYIKALDPLAEYKFEPVLKKSAWDEFGDGTIKKFRVKVACPQSFAGASSGGIDDTIKNLSNTYSAPYINIELSVGNKKDGLLNTIKDAAKDLLEKHNIMSMKAHTFESKEPIDLMMYVLQDSDVLKIDNDPLKSYEIRSNFVRRSLTSNTQFLIELYDAS